MVKNFQKVNEIVSTGAQPSVEQFSELKSNNYEVVINLSPESTPNYLNNERDVVRDLELEYFHLPIDCTVLKEEQYDDFKRIMDNVRNKKTFIHCGGNIKSSGFYYIYQVKSEGMEKEEAIKPLKELNVHDQKWYDYFKKWDVKDSRIEAVYKKLLKEYGPQGWWPLMDVDGTNPTKTGSINGYHPGNYKYPFNENQQLEIAIGAILTQNTAWPNVEKALKNLKKECGINCNSILKINIEDLKELIKPAGFFNQKANYIKNFIQYFKDLKGSVPERKDLLHIKGIGEETADSILLYSFRVNSFVIDSYTKRIFNYLEIIDSSFKYREIKRFFENNLSSDLITYQEYHALIVEHAKRYYSKKPYGENDNLLIEFKVSSK